jgi:hypothetical protein
MIESRIFGLARTMPLLALATCAVSCIDRVDTAVLSCPCAAGYSCCESGVCASEQTGCSQATAALSASVAGRWTGYVENLSGGDDAVSLTISIDDGGELSGSVTIGSATPPLPATDGTRAWPASIDQGIDTVPPDYLAGFSYTAMDMSWKAKRLRIRMPTYEPWESWCALQQSHATADGYRCYPSGNLQSDLVSGPILDAEGNCQIDADPSSTSDPYVSFSCARYAMCDTVRSCICQAGAVNCTCGGNGVCECDASGCHAGRTWMSVPIGHWFDLAFDGGNAEGSVSLGHGQTEQHNVRLTRAPAKH